MKWVAKMTRKFARKATAISAMVSVFLLMMVTSAMAAPATGDTDVDAVLTKVDAGFTTLKTAFWYLALAAIPITIAVLAFFWLRGKFKQSVSGA